MDDWLFRMLSSSTVNELISGVNVAVIILLFVAVFRKQWSCNRTYHTDDEEENGKSRTIKSFISMTEEDEQVTEHMLDQAGLVFNVKPLISALKSTTGSLTAKAHHLTISEEDERIAEDMLDGAGMLCNVTLFLTAMKNNSSRALALATATAHPVHQQEQPSDGSTSSHLLAMPHGVQVLICEFLHPRDVCTSLAPSCKTLRRTIEDSEAVWSALWRRDYSWVVTDWQPGIDALRRSNEKRQKSQKFKFTKDFYFRFGLCWADYVLAGYNGHTKKCLVALHGCVYDITPFLDTHPGSPDTLMVHSGRDATVFFEDMSHSMGARRIALGFCVVANQACNTADSDGVGLAPTQHTELIMREQPKVINNHSSCSSASVKPVLDGGNNLLLGRRQKQKADFKTLSMIRNRFDSETKEARARLRARYLSNDDVLGEANVYFDPFLYEWCVWYTSKNLCTVFPVEL